MQIAERDIEGRDAEGHEAVASYKCRAFPARPGLRILGRLAKLAGPAIGVLAEAVGTSDSKSKAMSLETIFASLNTGTLERAVRALVEHLDDPAVSELILEMFLVSTTLRQSPDTPRKFQDVAKGPVFDEVYSRNYGELFRVLYWLLEVSYGDFFGEGGFIGKLVEAAKSSGTMTLPPSPISPKG